MHGNHKSEASLIDLGIAAESPLPHPFHPQLPCIIVGQGVSPISSLGMTDGSAILNSCQMVILILKTVTRSH